MQRLLAIILLSCLHAQPAVNASVWIDYLVNNEYIKEVLCINKERPKLQCGGKCYLMQQLKKSETPQDENEPPITALTKIEYIKFAPYQTAIKKIFLPLKEKISIYYLINNYTSNLGDIFHPPQV